jgi:hypothetical protein
MGKDLLKKALPHVIAIAVFLIVALLFCKPALEGKALKQGDTMSWRAMAQGSFEYKEKNGHFPIWTTNMFSGMPGYQIAGEGPTIYTGYLHTLFTLGLSKPFHFFFLACICFYFLAMCLRVNTVIGILGSLAFAYASYSPIIVGAGHETKMLAIAYVPALIGSVILLYEKKYVWGFVLTALFTFLQLIMNHQQISYYAFLIITAMTIGYLAHWIKLKNIAGNLKLVGLAAAAGIIGVLATFHTILPNYEYSKESKRGRHLVIDSSKNNKESAKGMSQDYAFQWSLGKIETATLMFPGAVSYGAKGYEPDFEKSAIGKFASQTTPPTNAIDPNEVANNGYNNLYWGGQPFTDGPFYIGAIICFLGILGFVTLKSHHRWWILGMSVFAVLLAWGRYLPGFNTFMFNKLPLYNKFRVPTMTLVVLQVLFPLLAMLTLQQFLFSTYTAEQRKALIKKTAITFGGVLLLSLIIFFSTSYSDENKIRTNLFNNIQAEQNSLSRDSLVKLIRETPGGADNEIKESILQKAGPDGTSYANNFLSAVKSERKSVFGSSMVRSFLFIGLALAALLAFLWLKFNPLIAAGIILAAIAGDELSFGSKYLSKENYAPKDEVNRLLNPKTTADLKDFEQNIYESTLEQLQERYPDAPPQQLISYSRSQAAAQAKYYELMLQTKSLYKDNNFRVHNLMDDPWNRSTAAFYIPIIGGYHPAKIGRYDDLITYQLGNGNPAVLDMLNTKYILQRNDSTGAPERIDRGSNLGNCWFIKTIQPVKNDKEEMLALNNFNPAETVFINEEFKNIYGKQAPQFDSAATIKQTIFDNDHITYESNAAAPQFAVFSEVYYSMGWKVLIDGTETDYCRVDYLLRGLPLPAGKHKIEFIFKPASIKTSFTIAAIFGNLCLVLLAGAVYWQFRKPKKAIPLDAKA